MAKNVTVSEDDLIFACGMTAYTEWALWNGQDEEGPVTVLDDEFSVQVSRRGPDAKGWPISEVHKMNWRHTGGAEDVIRFRKIRAMTPQESEAARKLGRSWTPDAWLMSDMKSSMVVSETNPEKVARMLKDEWEASPLYLHKPDGPK